MSLVLGIDYQKLPDTVRPELEHLTAQLQTWAGKVDGAGKWVDVPYNASYYRATAGAWTVEAGDQRAFRYSIMQDIMFLRVALLETSTDANVTNDFRVLIPAGYRTTDKYYMGDAQWNAGGAGLDGLAKVFGRTPPDDNYLSIVRDVLAVSTNWPANEANTLNIQFNLAIPVYRDPNS